MSGSGVQAWHEDERATGCGLMAEVEVVIKQTSSGVIHTYHDQVEDKYSGGQLYLWTEGNYGCDCNLADFWHDDGYDHEQACGETAYELVSLHVNDTQVYP